MFETPKLNFGLHRAYPKRIIFDEKRTKEVERWDKGYFQDASVQKISEAIVALVRKVDKALGAVYHSAIYQAAMGVELMRNQIAYWSTSNLQLYGIYAASLRK